MSDKEEIERRRTFGIISHPDAGKTTLTEKLLLFGGAIQTAGAVKSNKNSKSATSDFMEIERQRGISVATSVMGFDYKGVKINLLDTPGHQDFCEDTYRTLTAVDSVIMVIDCVKGVESQTEKLLEVCRMRNTPVIVFINKLDREGRDPYDLLDEIESKLKINVCPLSWPISMGKTFKGVYSLFEKSLLLFQPSGSKLEKDTFEIKDIKDPKIDEMVSERYATKLREDIELLSVYPEFSKQDYLQGKISPVFFGSAVNNFGIRELLDCFIQIAPTPLSRDTDARTIQPEESKFTGFVFKIHANMDARHRDRLAFVRVCSGKFERNTNYYHTRLDKQLKFSNPTAFMAQEKTIIEAAYPGDIVGLYDTGNFKIGDTLTQGEKLNFKGIPSFSPELFRYVINADPMKSKQLAKGLEQFTDEGVAQLFTKMSNASKILGTVGALQFEVIQYRLNSEYSASCNFESLNLHKACWVTCRDKKKLQAFVDDKFQHMAKDKEDNFVFLAESAWALQMAQEKNPDIEFHFTSEY
ncbi:MAG: peptide chain release factor 3 [Bacteroidetes bacterium]|nr:peptide chain release factor 3 [Bacteroidota bacterium]